MEHETNKDLIPTPLAWAGIGLIVSIAIPGGISGGEGFVYGFLVGLFISIVHVFCGNKVTIKCPKCGHKPVDEGLNDE